MKRIKFENIPNKELPRQLLLLKLEELTKCKKLWQERDSFITN